MLTIRIDKNMQEDIEKLAKQSNKSKSEFVRECLAEYITNYEKPSAWELGHAYFRKYASGDGKLSKNRKQNLTKTLEKKHAQNIN